MMHTRVVRIPVVALIAALAASTVVRAQAPAAAAITPALIEAAKKEGKVVFYTAMDLTLAQRFGRSFEAAYPGIAARVERWPIPAGPSGHLQFFVEQLLVHAAAG